MDDGVRHWSLHWAGEQAGHGGGGGRLVGRVGACGSEGRSFVLISETAFLLPPNNNPDTVFGTSLALAL